MIQVTTSNQGTPPKPKYPYLGIWEKTGLIVMFIGEETGVVVDSGTDRDAVSERKLGYWDDEWAEDDFARFHGTVTLTNA